MVFFSGLVFGRLVYKDCDWMNKRGVVECKGGKGLKGRVSKGSIGLKNKVADKYRVRTKCLNCGKVYTTKAKKDRTPASQCKNCKSEKTTSLRSHPV